MKNLYPDKFSSKYKKVLGNYEPSYNPDHWQRMKEKLNNAESLPPNDSQRKSGFLLSMRINRMRIAATIMGFIALSVMVYYLTAESRYKNIHVITKLDEHTEVMMPDGSTVILNELSDLRYSAKLFKKTRELILTGEAYFTITRDVNRPFIIHTPRTLVTVLGTSFNIRAYPGEKQEIVVVSDGTVHVSLKETTNAPAVILKEGENVLLSNNSQSLHKNYNTDLNYKTWMTGELIFSNTTLNDVVLSLNKYYKVNIIIDDEELKDRTLTATFRDEPFEDVLEVLELVFYLQIEHKNEKIFLNKKPNE